MDEGADDHAVEPPPEKRRPARVTQASTHLSRSLSDPSSRPHLLRGPGGNPRRRNAAHKTGAGRLGSSAAGRGYPARLGRRPKKERRFTETFLLFLQSFVSVAVLSS